MAIGRIPRVVGAWSLIGRVKQHVRPAHVVRSHVRSGRRQSIADSRPVRSHAGPSRPVLRAPAGDSGRQFLAYDTFTDGGAEPGASPIQAPARRRAVSPSGSEAGAGPSVPLADLLRQTDGHTRKPAFHVFQKVAVTAARGEPQRPAPAAISARSGSSSRAGGPPNSRLSRISLLPGDQAQGGQEALGPSSVGDVAPRSPGPGMGPAVPTATMARPSRPTSSSRFARARSGSRSPVAGRLHQRSSPPQAWGGLVLQEGTTILQDHPTSPPRRSPSVVGGYGGEQWGRGGGCTPVQFTALPCAERSLKRPPRPSRALPPGVRGPAMSWRAWGPRARSRSRPTGPADPPGARWRCGWSATATTSSSGPGAAAGRRGAAVPAAAWSRSTASAPAAAAGTAAGSYVDRMGSAEARAATVRLAGSPACRG